MSSKPYIEVPVFFDRSGKRWKWVKRILLLIFISGIILISKFLTSTIKPVNKMIPWQDNRVSSIQKTDITNLKIPHKVSQSLFPFNEQELPYSASDMASLTGGEPFKILPRDKSTAYIYVDNLPADIAYSFNRNNMPILGTGPFVRVVALTKFQNKFVGVDPYTGIVTRELSQAEAQTVGNYTYAIEKYGDMPNGKRIALTFDDGPDAVYTPKVLDLLAKEHVTATFFMIGKNIVLNQQIAERVVREGHAIGNHTFNHVDFDFYSDNRGQQEINQTERIIQASTKHSTSYFRLPYEGNDDKAYRDNVRGILAAQRLGYTISTYEFDSRDWLFPYGQKQEFPDLDGGNQVILLHDAGGNREKTLEYLPKLIEEARSQGYTFTTLDGFYTGVSAPLFNKTKFSITNAVSLIIAKAILVWPHTLVTTLFTVTVITIFLTLIINIILASVQLFTVSYRRRQRGFNPLVTVVIPAYNEEKVIAKTVRSIRQSYYRNFEILLVDDGSTDSTWNVMQKLLKNSRRMMCLHQPNRGKAEALNNGVEHASGEIIIAIDADTIFLPSTLNKLVRHFSDSRVGAVAGVVKVGNIRNPLTRWQALEYLTGINIQRTAQALLKGITIVPGACGAWRKQALIDAGGYSRSTLAEDCDLTLAVHKAGYKVLQDTEAISVTEAPESVRNFAKQRFRWTFGNIQSYWKHKDMLFRPKYKWLGGFVLPTTIISILLPFAFIPILLAITIQDIAQKKFLLLAFYLIVTLLLQFIVSFISIIMAREKFSHLWAVPISRIIYSPLRTYVLYGSIVTALRGVHVGWNKFSRSGNVKLISNYPSLVKQNKVNQPLS